jgi:hypothetical protein
MTIKRSLLSIALVVLLASPVFSQCDPEPLDGQYSTYAGTLLPGRVSEAWCTIMSPGVPGNTENAMSWDGTALGTQWHVWGMAIDAFGAIETARSIDGNGTGWIDYTTNYDGGLFWLSGSGPWGGTPAGFTGFLTYYNVSTRVSYYLGQMVGATSNVFFTGVFDNCPNCAIEYSIANAMFVWRTGMPNEPSPYPPFLCGASAGEYFEACCILTKIHCNPVGTEPATWGAIKSIYR